MRSLSARLRSRVALGYRAGGEGTQVAQNECEGGPGPGTWFLNRLAACFVIPKPACRRTRKKKLFSSTSLLMKRAANCSSSSADGTLGRSGPPAHLLGAREIFMAVRNREYSRGGGSVDVPMNLDLVAEVVSLVRSNYDGRPAAGRRRHERTPQGTSCPDLDRARALRCYSGTSIF